ncbi:hydrolase [Bordetella ansorpii]|uniref:Hydrolase n=1 Tax=Bordetella ansorpii TaxID=288768 RepID=A0A157SMS7_9BORD|nr:alpha/beta hydrolase [Bordetella ansorpii]SAI71737.1 hydrolase [Bordetella ansorpii]
MLEPRLEYVTCASPAGLHRMAYWEWGDPANDQVVVCVHGLTRTGRDFDELARQLAGRYRVVCPDVVGRGASDWLVNPAFYTIPQYAADMVTLLARLRPSTLYWVGTSMGGLIGMALSGSATMARAIRFNGSYTGGHPQALPATGAIRFDKLVLNDVGPRLDAKALQRIGDYVGAPGEYASFAQAVQAVREGSATFGPHTDEQWETFTRRVYRERGDGHWVKHYDLGLAVPMAAQGPEVLAAGEQLLWQAYDAVDCPILIVRGAESDLLSAATLAEMQARNPRARAVSFDGVGHAPTLMTPAQIEPVARFLGEA